MDVVLDLADTYVLDGLYSSLPPFTSSALSPYFADRDSVPRQAFSLWLIVWLFGTVLYFGFASLSYRFMFDKELMKHPKFLPNQVSMEISLTVRTMPLVSLYTVPWFLGEVRGHSKLYDRVDDHPWGWAYLAFSMAWFLLFTDCLIYWIHRFEHHPSVYNWLHKPHHLWKISTPYASHAFHSLVRSGSGVRLGMG
ncbi:lathosterol oxidase [Hyaloraphidium curvatum]|nr:lathosterol oxidase [Hyaloraphidium curvatum]